MRSIALGAAAAVGVGVCYWFRRRNSVLDRFIGEYDLVEKSFFFQLTSGEKKYPMGEDAVGRIMYTSNGYMTAHMMQKDRAVIGSPDFNQMTPDERSTAFKECIAYQGTFDIDPVAKQVTHHVATATMPTMVGTDMVRDYVFSEGDQLLTLKLVYHDGNRASLSWRRVPPHAHKMPTGGPRPLG